ncbi:XdhC family protein [Nocardia sp. alder85J]|uniref:XdhC family protein n=1 Tax=Nocardia sp. alder85J TaxID=2862949 RepID=UPI001CD48B10|nr:XdhC/CoxI family protein [Nocardia sp. alder85J]MCX4097964.1 XdhC family protein [Nocardia sp. alder85J]
MRELAAELSAWHAAGRSFAVATIVDVTGSAPRPVGATMAVDTDGRVLGSLSGGCVEGAVYELCREVLESGQPVRETFGYSESDPFAAGLTCGGALDVFVHRVTTADRAVLDAVLHGPEPVALVRDLSTGRLLALAGDETIGDPFPAEVIAAAAAMLDTGATGLRTVGCEPEEITVFVESFTPPPRMIVVGAIDFAAAVAGIGRFLGYHVTVCDARPVFATPARFPDADEVVVDWPHRYLASTRMDSRTVVCVLTHDPKFDIPVLELALRLPIAYVGALGSRRADRDRRAHLRAAGLTDAELARLHSPIGLNLGGHTPAETAVAIAAEIVAHRRGGTTRPLSATDDPIHAPRPVPVPPG